MRSETTKISSGDYPTECGVIQISQRLRSTRSIKWVSEAEDAREYHLLMYDTKLNFLHEPANTVTGPLTVRTE